MARWTEVEQPRIKRAIELLKSKGIKMSVSGCGCCGSPSMYLEIDGEAIIGTDQSEEDNVNFNTEEILDAN